MLSWKKDVVVVSNVVRVICSSYWKGLVNDLSRLWPHCVLFVGEIEPDSSVQPIGESRHIVIVSLWSPYGIGQTIIFSCCSLFFLFFRRLIYFIF